MIDGIEKNLALQEHHTEPSRATLRDYGNTSSSSIWCVGRAVCLCVCVRGTFVSVTVVAVFRYFSRFHLFFKAFTGTRGTSEQQGITLAAAAEEQVYSYVGLACVCLLPRPKICRGRHEIAVVVAKRPGCGLSTARGSFRLCPSRFRAGLCVGYAALGSTVSGTAGRETRKGTVKPARLSPFSSFEAVIFQSVVTNLGVYTLFASCTRCYRLAHNAKIPSTITEIFNQVRNEVHRGALRPPPGAAHPPGKAQQ